MLMKKAKLHFIIAGCVAFYLSETNGAHAESPLITNAEVRTDFVFTDIANNYWAKNEIMQLAEMNILKGDRDLQFRPEDNLTKGEAAYALAKALELQAIEENYRFEDIVSTSFEREAIASVYAAGWFEEESPGVFGAGDAITRQELGFALIQSFELDTGGEKLLAIWPSATNKGQNGMVSTSPILNAHDILENTTTTVSRSVFAKLLYQLMKDSGRLEQTKTYTINRKNAAHNFTSTKQPVHIMKVPIDESSIYLRSPEQIQFVDHKQIDNSTFKHDTYLYKVGKSGAEIELTYKSFDNGDQFIFSRLTNPGKHPVTADILQKETDVKSFEIIPHERFPNTKTSSTSYHTDTVNFSSGVFRLTKMNGAIEERMIGRSNPNSQLVLNFENGGGIFTRELLAEREALTYTKIGTALLSIYTLRSKGEDIVDQWAIDSTHPLFDNDEHLNGWMKEINQHYKQKNKGYTVIGHFNNKTLTTEPMREFGQRYVRNSLKSK